VLFSYKYSIEIYKIIEATFLTLHFLPYASFFAGLLMKCVIKDSKVAHK